MIRDTSGQCSGRKFFIDLSGVERHGMSRKHHFVKSLSSGLAQIGANTLFTLVSLQLALHYLSREQWGLWGLVVQVAGYFAFVDFGITAALSRFLVDHKDDRVGGSYGAVIKTGLLVLVAQGAIVIVFGCAIAWAGPGLFNLTGADASALRNLLAGYALVMGLLFPQRMFNAILIASHRFDISNHSLTLLLLVNLAVLWAGLSFGLGIYSLLLGYALGLLCATLVQLLAVIRLKLLPARGTWGKASRSIFKELFSFGWDVSLLTLGQQLFNGSQLIIITRIPSLGLEAAAIWGATTKAFALMQQFVWRLWDYSYSAVSEMVVRQERERLALRFQDIVTFTASLGVFLGICVAVCNESFVQIWSSNRLAWQPHNDVLMALLFVVNAVTRLHIGLLGSTKKVQGMRYVYLFQGVLFVVLASLAGRWLHFAGILITAIAVDVLCAGTFGPKRTADELGLSLKTVTLSWLAPAARLALALAPLAFATWWMLRPVPALPRFITGGLVVGTVGIFLLWRLGLTPSLRHDISSMLAKWKGRFTGSSL
jgi:hypothetical protein